MPDLTDLHQQTPSVYEANARAWDQQRHRIFFEKNWLDRFLQHLPENGSILDVGCGAGDPISGYLQEKEYKLWGIDSSPTMIEISNERYPDASFKVMDMRDLDLDRKFDGILSWDGFFHLNPSEQRKTLPLFTQHLKAGGALLLTIGDEEGEITGVVNGHQVYHASLNTQEYKTMLKELGFKRVTITLNDPGCDMHSVLLASGFGE